MQLNKAATVNHGDGDATTPGCVSRANKGVNWVFWITLWAKTQGAIGRFCLSKLTCTFNALPVCCFPGDACIVPIQEINPLAPGSTFCPSAANT